MFLVTLQLTPDGPSGMNESDTHVALLSIVECHFKKRQSNNKFA